MVTELAAELVMWAERVRKHVKLGRICSETNFHRRVAVNVAALERVVARDERYAAALDAAAAREEELRS